MFLANAITEVVVLPEDGSCVDLVDAVVLEHAIVYPRVFAFDPNHCLWCFRFQDVMIITMRAVLVALLIRRHVLPERLLALLAQESHLRCFRERVSLFLGVTFGAVVPLLAAWGTDGDLCVQDVFTAYGEGPVIGTLILIG